VGWLRRLETEDIPILTALCGSGQLDLDAIDAVDAVYEEDENEDECYL